MALFPQQSYRHLKVQDVKYPKLYSNRQNDCEADAVQSEAPTFIPSLNPAAKLYIYTFAYALVSVWEVCLH